MSFILNSIWILLFMVAFHELGHYFYLRSLGKKVGIYINKWLVLTVGKREDYQDLNNLQYLKVNLSGILLGLAPIFLWISDGSYIYLMLLAPYIGGCSSDLIEISKVLKWRYLKGYW